MFFDGTNDDENAFEDLPAGEYTAVVRLCVQHEGKNNPANLMYKVEFEIVDPKPHAGRKHWEYLIFQSNNETAQRIGRSQMKKLVLAVTGKPAINTSDELYNKPFKLVLKSQKQGDGELRVRMSKTLPYEGPVISEVDPF